MIDITLLVDGRDRGIEVQVDALLGHLVTREFTHFVVKATQEQVAAIAEMSLGAQAIEDAGELNRDIASANDEETLGEAFQIEDAIRV